MHLKLNENTTISISLTMLISAISFVIVTSWGVYSFDSRIDNVEDDFVVINTTNTNTQKLLDAQQHSIATLRERTYGLEKQTQLMLQMIEQD